MSPKGLVDIKLIQKHHTIPLFRRGNRLFIAVSDPTNLRALDEIKFHTGINTDAVLVEEGALAAAIQKYLDANEDSMGSLGELDEAGLEDLDIESVDENARDDDARRQVADEAPIVKFINKILDRCHSWRRFGYPFRALRKKLPYSLSHRRHSVRRRQATGEPVPIDLAARLKVMSQMDISERRVPQDGRIKMKLSKTRAIDFRVNSLPTIWGEKVVLRILDPSSAKLGIDALGYEPDPERNVYACAATTAGHDSGHRPDR